MELFKTNLHLFDGEGGDGTAAPPTASDETASTQDAPAAEEVAEPTPEDRKKAYQDFKKANKDLFTEDFQEQFNKRFKSHKETEAKLKQYSEMAEMLYSKYNVDNLESLQKAMDADDSLIMEKADEAGMTVDQYRQFYKLEKQNKELLAKEEQRQKDMYFGEQVSKWRGEESELKQTYPNFSLDMEYENPTFRAVLNSGASVKDAFRMVHFDELMQANQANTEKAVAQNIRAKGNRPTENGTRSQSAFTSKKNVNELSNDDIDELIQRARRGEMISFG